MWEYRTVTDCFQALVLLESINSNNHSQQDVFGFIYLISFHPKTSFTSSIHLESLSYFLSHFCNKNSFILEGSREDFSIFPLSMFLCSGFAKNALKIFLSVDRFLSTFVKKLGAILSSFFIALVGMICSFLSSIYLVYYIDFFVLKHFCIYRNYFIIPRCITFKDSLEFHVITVRDFTFDLLSLLLCYYKVCLVSSSGFHIIVPKNPYNSIEACQN